MKPTTNVTHISDKMKFSGKITFSDSLIIEGFVDATIQGGQLLQIKNTSTVTGEMSVKNLYVDGMLKGNAHKIQYLEISSKGNIIGDIQTKYFVTHKGAKYNGNIIMND